MRYSPDGNLLLTGSSDQKAFLYDGKAGKLVSELGGGATPAHAVRPQAPAGRLVMLGRAASMRSRGVLTASVLSRPLATRLSRLVPPLLDTLLIVVQLWDVEKNVAVTTFTFGDELENQQLGCLWQVQRCMQ